VTTASSRSNHQLARDVADSAGRLLLEIRKGLANGVEPADVRRQGDLRSHDLILRRLRLEPLKQEFSRRKLLSSCTAPAESDCESSPRSTAHGSSESWRDDWAVHVSLVDAGRPVAGAVALPALGMTYATDRPPRAPAVPHRALRIAASRTRPTQEAAGLARRLHGELVPTRRGFPTSSRVEPSFAIESSKHYTTSGRQLRSQ
jgi:3'(2'), 5'-bisphosphate nucleotidase